MGWIKDILRRFRVIPGQKISGDIEWMSGGADTSAGVKITPESSLSSTAVFAAVRRISQGLAMLPLPVYRRMAPGSSAKERARGYHLYAILHDSPNPELTAFEFREMMQASVLVRGNAFAEIEYNAYGQAIGLWPLRSDRTRVERKNGNVWYHTIINGREYVLPKERIFHLKGFSLYGLLGLCALRQCKDAIGTSLATERYQGKFFKNDATPGGILQHPGVMGPDARKNLMESWQAMHGGLKNRSRMAILEEGLEFKQVGVSNQDAQMIASRTFQIGEVARIFDIPPHLLAELSHATFTNIEHQSLEFVIYTLGPWLKRWEQRISLDLIPARDRELYFAEFVLQGLLRGDVATRSAYYREMLSTGVMSINEVRELENLNPIGDEGNMHLVQLSMIPVGDLGGSWTDQADRTDRIYGGEKEKRGKADNARRAAERLRLRVRYRSLFKDAGGRLVRGEVNDLKKGMKLQLPRGADSFKEWMKSYYGPDGDFGKLVKKSMGPSINLYAAEMSRVASKEEGLDEQDIGDFETKYRETFALRHAGKSEHHIYKVIEEIKEEENLAGALETRISDWEKERPAAIAQAETVRLADSVAKTVWELAGVMSFVWNANAGACPLCAALDGKIISQKNSFVQKGGTVDPGDGETAPLTVPSDIGHAPLHAGCECYITAG